MRRVVTLLLATLFLMAVSSGALAAAPQGSTVISNELNSTVTAQAVAPPYITLSWDLGQTKTVFVGKPFKVMVTAVLTDSGKVLRDEGSLTRLLYIVEVTKDGSPAPSNAFSCKDDLTNQFLGYDQSGGFWYWGPPGGFTWDSSKGDQQQTTFTCTVNSAGTFNVKLYAVQLPSQ